jgi:hypothetical protein
MKDTIHSANQSDVFEYLLRREEVSMTFQVALVGSDGIVVGSDTHGLYMQPSGSKIMMQPFSGSKLLFGENREVDQPEFLYHDE